MPLKSRKASTSLILGGIAAVAVLGASMGVAQLERQASQNQRAEEAKKELRVGTYEPQRVFQSSHHAAKLSERIGPLQVQAQEAQAQGDQQRLMEIQDQMQTAQSEIVQEFLADVERAIPEVAAESNVKVVALEVVWVDSELDEPKDLSSDIIAELNNGAEAQQTPRSPFAPSER